MLPKTTVVAHFEIPYFRYLDEKGHPEQDVPEFAKDKETLVAMYRMMVLTRLFDKKAVALQRTGKLGTYPPNIGQEAIGVGLGAGMKPDDVLVPYYREYGGMFWRGVTMEEVLLYWGGDERGSDFAKSHDFPICVPIATQTLQAAGAAFAFAYRKQKNAVLTVVGDGGTSRGDFYESMNVAGVWNLPLVFLINNNHYAISIPRDHQSKAQTLAQKGIAAGLESWQIDGNDILAVRDAVERAMEKARQGKGATVIEALSYRMGDHTTADDASRYRPAEELKEHEKCDPIMRLRNYMHSLSFWDLPQEEALLKELALEVEEAVKRFEAMSPQSPESMFEHLYETLPAAYMAQRDAVKRGE